ncbi:MAG: lipase family protein [Rhizobiaceae bacterium]|nr:lipase family protein [Rhizobiaceae bacterium]
MQTHLLPARLMMAFSLVAILTLSGCISSTKTDGSIKTISTSQQAKGKITSQTKSGRQLAPYVTQTGEVILLRGLANIFSRGMDVIGDRLQAKGVDARVYNHSAWESLAIDIVERARKKQVSYPIIIMGHSLGANAAVQMAAYLGERGIPVSYVVAFDPTVTTYAGKKVRRVVNYYLPNGENIVRRGRGFKGKLSNINVSNINGIKHTTVEKTRRLQNRSINTVMKLVKKRRKKRG